VPRLRMLEAISLLTQ